MERRSRSRCRVPCSRVAPSLPFVGGKPSIKLTLEAAPLVNSCGRSSGLPLTVRVLQVSDASALSGATLDHLWDREEKVLGSALLSHADVVVDPGTRKETSIDRVAQAKTAVVVGNFCKAEGTCWYLIKPLKERAPPSSWRSIRLASTRPKH